jgi:hypothetical protein
MKEQVRTLKVGEKIIFERKDLKKFRTLVTKGLLIIAIPDGKYKIERIY